MKAFKNQEIVIVNTTREDLSKVIRLFNQAIQLEGKDGYKVWNKIDLAGLKKDIENCLQYKIVEGDQINCIFSIQYSDPYIWREKEKDDALYIHRAVANKEYKGQKQFGILLNWAIKHAKSKNLKYVRMDTWADNSKIINYYRSYGFEMVGYYKTPDKVELPVQNRNLDVALLELKLK
jgi:ribosomal protein S18 acetylase RimI-like enzyme